MLVNKYPLSTDCPYGCPYFEEVNSNRDYTNQTNQVSTLDESRPINKKEIRHVRTITDEWHISNDELELR